jgi:D-lyxose ketol-isomerase
MTNSNRRIFTACAAMLCLGLAMVAFSGCAKQVGCGCLPLTPVTNPGNTAFYKADGAFDAVAAKDAYFAMMKGYGYPIPAILKTDTFWVADFVQRDFETLGMGGVFWKNQNAKYGDIGSKSYKGDFKDASFGYLGHEIYLLPGQMLPEHNHTGGPDGYGPKMETWHIRHGSVEFFGQHQGEDKETPISEMAKADQPSGFGQDWFKSKYVVKMNAGGIYTLNDPESWHFMRAGPNGAIVSEYATYHNHVQFSKPEMVFDSSKAKK